MKDVYLWCIVIAILIASAFNFYSIEQRMKFFDDRLTNVEGAQ